MSFFLCLAVPQEAQAQLASAFDKRVHLTDASSFPIGKATRGRKHSWMPVLLQVGSSSASLIGKGGLRRTHNNDHTAILVSGIQRLLENEGCFSVSFLAHWMQGRIDQEQIVLKGEKQINLSEIAQSLLEVEEDVRYLVSTTGDAWPAAR